MKDERLRPHLHLADPVRSTPLGPAHDAAFAEAVRAGLTGTPKTLPSKFLYDDVGSQLFEAICYLPEYYLTRTERVILESYAQAIVRELDRDARLVELGAGSAVKTRILVRAMTRENPGLIYCPIDISMEAMRIAQANITSEFPTVQLRPMLGDWFESLAHMSANDPEQKLILFLGSSIGNLDAAEAVAFLDRIRAVMGANDQVLIGTDMVKSEAELLAAYDDASGVTAAFNKNMLARVNVALGGHFDTKTFDHEARWDDTHRRIEMHLVSRIDQSVHIDALDEDIVFEAGESIHTENSHKYRLEDVWAMAQAAGLRVHHTYQDAERRFAVHLMGLP